MSRTSLHEDTNDICAVIIVRHKTIDNVCNETKSFSFADIRRG